MFFFLFSTIIQIRNTITQVPDFFGGILSAALLYRMTWNNEEAFFHD